MTESHEVDNELNHSPQKPESNASIIAPFIMTAIVFFILGVMIAYISFGGSSDDTNNTFDLSRQETVVALSVDSTLDVLLPSPTALQLDDSEAISNAVNSTAIAQAVDATFVALTPTATPLPTDVPTELTFAEENPSKGPIDAPITLVEFSDYLCPYCARFHADTLDPLLEHYGDNVRFIYREYPIIGGQASVDIATAGACANLQDKYWEFADLIWENRLSAERPNIDAEMLDDFGVQLELDLGSYATCRTDGTGLDLVIADFEAGQEYRITGTPGFFVSGERFTAGAVPIEYFMDIIDAQLIDLGITPPERPA